jgi:hypothetical protein
MIRNHSNVTQLASQHLQHLPFATADDCASLPCRTRNALLETLARMPM